MLVSLGRSSRLWALLLAALPALGCPSISEWDRGIDLATVGRHEEALSVLDPIVAEGDAPDDTPPALGQARAVRSYALYREALEAEGRSEHEAALGLLRKAAALDPSEKLLTDALRSVESAVSARREVDAFHRAQDLLSEGRLSACRRFLEGLDEGTRSAPLLLGIGNRLRARRGQAENAAKEGAAALQSLSRKWNGGNPSDGLPDAGRSMDCWSEALALWSDREEPDWSDGFDRARRWWGFLQLAAEADEAWSRGDLATAVAALRKAGSFRQENAYPERLAVAEPCLAAQTHLRSGHAALAEGGLKRARDEFLLGDSAIREVPADALDTGIPALLRSDLETAAAECSRRILAASRERTLALDSWREGRWDEACLAFQAEREMDTESPDLQPLLDLASRLADFHRVYPEARARLSALDPEGAAPLLDRALELLEGILQGAGPWRAALGAVPLGRQLPALESVQGERRRAREAVGRQASLEAAEKALLSNRLTEAEARLDESRPPRGATDPRWSVAWAQLQARQRFAEEMQAHARDLGAQERFADRVEVLKRARSLWADKEDLRVEEDRAKRSLRFAEIEKQGRLEESLGNLESAVERFRQALALESVPELEARRTAVRNRADGIGKRIEARRHFAAGKEAFREKRLRAAEAEFGLAGRLAGEGGEELAGIGVYRTLLESRQRLVREMSERAAKKGQEKEWAVALSLVQNVRALWLREDQDGGTLASLDRIERESAGRIQGLDRIRNSETDPEEAKKLNQRLGDLEKAIEGASGREHEDLLRKQKSLAEQLGQATRFTQDARDARRGQRWFEAKRYYDLSLGIASDQEGVAAERDSLEAETGYRVATAYAKMDRYTWISLLFVLLFFLWPLAPVARPGHIRPDRPLAKVLAHRFLAILVVGAVATFLLMILAGGLQYRAGRRGLGVLLMLPLLIPEAMALVAVVARIAREAERNKKDPKSNPGGGVFAIGALASLGILAMTVHGLGRLAGAFQDQYPSFAESSLLLTQGDTLGLTFRQWVKMNVIAAFAVIGIPAVYSRIYAPLVVRPVLDRVLPFLGSQRDPYVGKYAVALALFAVAMISGFAAMRHSYAIALAIFVAADLAALYVGGRHIWFQRRIMAAMDRGDVRGLETLATDHGPSLRTLYTGPFALFVMALQVLSIGGAFACIANLSHFAVLGPLGADGKPVPFAGDAFAAFGDGLAFWLDNVCRTTAFANVLEEYGLGFASLAYKGFLGGALIHVFRVQFDLVFLAAIVGILRRHSAIHQQIQAIAKDAGRGAGFGSADRPRAVLKALNRLGVYVDPYLERLAADESLAAHREVFEDLRRELRDERT